MAAREIDLDKVVDYRAEYTAVVQKYKLTGDKLTGLCPFHEDRNNSVSVDLKTGKWHCFAEDRGGNFVSFWAEFHGVDTKEAYKQILEKYGVSTEAPKPAKKEKAAVLEGFSLAEYAFAKHLPEEWLAKTCRLETRKDRNNGTEWLYIPYYNAAGEESTYRKRYAHKDFRWRTGSSGKICLYGEWRIPEFANAGYAVMVEGESDTQSLWYMGIPAIGVPGASMFKPEQSSVLQGLKLYLHHVPDGGGYAIMAGLQQFIDAVDHLKFTGEDIDYLRSTKAFDEKFLTYLANFKLHCNIWAIEEGMPIFPQEPIVTVEGPAIECQLLETLLLVTFNHQCLIATKANRIVRSAAGRPVMEFGARRAQGYDAAYFGARASYIGGCGSTSCVMAARDFGIPASGTMAHSWVQMFPTEYDAFKKYAEMYPDACVLLVDTYNVLRHGVPDAIKVFDEVLKPMGKRPKGVRIDSGDIAYLSKKARQMLDAAGYPDCTVCASNSLDEYIVRDLILQGARVDSFGIGENMITAKSDPVFGGVYKLAAVKEDDGSYTPKMKLSESVEKMTIPCLKKVWRIYDEDGKAQADLITMADEVVDTKNGITLFDPIETWKECTYVNSTARCISTPIYENGKRVYTSPNLADIRKFCKAQVGTLWDEVKRFENPHRYYVDLSRNLWDTRSELLKKLSK